MIDARFGVVNGGNMKCAQCRFWNDTSGRRSDHLIEECRRHHPTMMSVSKPVREFGDVVETQSNQVILQSVWPKTNGFDWCGDFEPCESKPG